MAYAIATPSLGYPKIGVVHDSELVPVGTTVKAYDPTYGEGEFIFLRGSASIFAGSLCYYSDNATANTAKLTTTSGVVDGGSPVCIASAAIVANKYGWFQIGGRALVYKTATKIDPASTFKVYLSGTAGRVMPTSVAGRQVIGARFQNAATVTTTTSTCVVTLNRPSQKTGTLV
jgi:hypothetical protein